MGHKDRKGREEDFVAVFAVFMVCGTALATSPSSAFLNGCRDVIFKDELIVTGGT
jgi:hypothetical protein